MGTEVHERPADARSLHWTSAHAEGPQLDAAWLSATTPQHLLAP